MPTFTVTRTQDEIAKRFAEADDFFGWARDVLIEFMDFEHANPHLDTSVTPEQWNDDRETDLAIRIRRYFEFAVGKIRDERGLSAERSVIKLTEMAWLAGRDDVVQAMDDAPYPMYGEPKVRAFASGMGLDWPEG